MESSSNPLLVVLLGPTGVGKTDLCIRLADTFHVPIINADSRQIFAEIPIGTAAPTKEQLARVKHYFVGTHHLQDYYSASMFEQDALNIIQNEFLSHPCALMSGGSMMYIDAVCNGIDDIPTVDDKTRTWMKRRLAEEGLPALVQELKKLDPEHYAVVDKQNPRRVVHALEICHMTGKTYTSFRTNSKKERPFRILKIGLNRPREELYDRINRRVDQMMADGWLDEARSVYPLRHLNALNTVGYKELFLYFDGTWSLEEAVERIKGNTRRYMRKQLTWFKRDPEIHWFTPDETDEIVALVKAELSK
ncbi:MAG: tRNA (adenosine(37)-N6)-dimethylallyltransferase MiaA [Bacteroidales bacterium]|nr:tRNA (adenosine(37)-N6)-dimethylallyltransferase MiaA [Bacteroidales bacterium]